MIATEPITITTAELVAGLDAIARAIDVPGRLPQDAQNASTLLFYVVAGLRGTPDSRLLMNTLERRGARCEEAQAVANSLQALVLRLGAWLGRNAR